jgi:hypothetical protein
MPIADCRLPIRLFALFGRGHRFIALVKLCSSLSLPPFARLLSFKRDPRPVAQVFHYMFHERGDQPISFSKAE